MTYTFHSFLAIDSYNFLPNLFSFTCLIISFAIVSQRFVFLRLHPFAMSSKSGKSNVSSSPKVKSAKKVKETDAFDDDPRTFVGRYRNLLLLKMKLDSEPEYKVNRLEEKTIQVTLASLYSAGEVAFQKKTSYVKAKPSAAVIYQCNVCYSDFDEDVRPVTLRVCGHASICSSCFHTYLNGLIKDDLILPYLRCPHPECHEIISHLDIVEKSKLSSIQLVQLLTQHMSKILPRHPEWLPCGTMPIKDQTQTAAVATPVKGEQKEKPASFVVVKLDKEEEEKTNDMDTNASSPISARTRSRNSNQWSEKKSDSPTTPVVVAPQDDKKSEDASKTKPANTKCPFGFLVDPHNTEKKIRRCEHCLLAQEVRYFDPQELVLDDATRELVENGTLRACPSCKAYNMKDYGICNVIQCHTCQIWWNWSSREMGKSQDELKNKARMKGTLWGMGELAYQQRLQRENLPEFIALLKRNGIEYDPNYIRGS